MLLGGLDDLLVWRTVADVLLHFDIVERDAPEEILELAAPPVSILGHRVSELSSLRNRVEPTHLRHHGKHDDLPAEHMRQADGIPQPSPRSAGLVDRAENPPEFGRWFPRPDSEDGLGSVFQDRLRDGPYGETIEGRPFSGPDQDQVGVDLLGLADDRIGGVSQDDRRLGDHHLLRSQPFGHLLQRLFRLFSHQVLGHGPGWDRLQHVQERHARFEGGSQLHRHLRRLLARRAKVGGQQD